MTFSSFHCSSVFYVSDISGSFQFFSFSNFFPANCDDSKSHSKSIKYFLLNVDKKSRFAPNVDSSSIDRHNALRLISDVTKLNQENTDDVIDYYVATFCLHDCFFIKFRYFGGFADKNERSNMFVQFFLFMVLQAQSIFLLLLPKLFKKMDLTSIVPRILVYKSINYQVFIFNLTHTRVIKNIAENAPNLFYFQ
jgi:hypothetical protein